MKVNRDLVWLAVGFFVMALFSYGISQYYLNRVQAISNMVDAQLKAIYDWLNRAIKGENMTSPPPQVAYYTYWVLGQEYKYPANPYRFDLDVFLEMDTLRASVEVPYIFSWICFGAGIASLILSLRGKKNEEQDVAKAEDTIIL